MNIDRHNERAFHGSLEEVFNKVLSAAELRTIYEFFFHETKKRPLPKKKARKAEMADAFINLAETPDDFYLFVKTLPKKAYQAYELLIWKNSIPVLEAQKTLGFELTIKSERANWQLGGYAVKKAFTFIGLMADSNSYYNRFEEGLAPYSVSMPPAIRKWLKPYFPKPDGYDIQPLSGAELPKTSDSTFDASPTITADLGQLADFLKRSAVPRTKKGDYTKVSIRKADGLTEYSDWYPSEKGKSDLTLMRHELLLDFIDGFDGAIVKDLTGSEVSSGVFKRILKALQQDDEMLAKWLLGHLKQRYTYYDEAYDHQAIARLFSLFERLPRDAWVSTDNLKSVQFYQDIDTLFFDSEKYSFRLLGGRSRYRYNNEYDLDRKHLQPIGIDPLIDGMAFLLSAFGFIELAYQAPKNDTYRTEKIPYLTRFDGALAIRLTDIGAYAFGLSAKLKLKQTNRKVATLRLHPEQLHVSCSDLDPITELALNDFMERLAPEFYRMTRTTLLKGCQKPKDVRQRIADFRKRIPAKLPPNWETFLSSLEAEKSALKSERSLTIYTLADRPDLQRHFMQDPVLRPLALRVEGHRVAIELKDLATVRTHLRKLGYLVET